jgi:cysteinyl-tRNA synthetase
MTELRLYNTLTRQKERFEPIEKDNVRMYVCGPTVYDFAHIGNARPVIVFDVLFRLLHRLYGRDHVTYVRNITDVEDKINARARRDYADLPLNDAIARVTQQTADQFHADVKALGCLPPTFEPRATQHIGGMIEMIGELLKRGHAYVATGQEGREVLFDVGSMPDYGQLSKRRLDEQQAGARVAVEAHKKNPEDFVLWKESSASEPGWEAEFAENGGKTAIYGRPGWHIECSVMAEAHLGRTFDIHGGGLDLIFPHHENEIAQSRCAHGTKLMARYWIHNGYLQLEGRKMSKSEGNFVTIRDLLETDRFGGRKWPPEVLRLAMLMTHYREPIDFSVSRLQEALTIFRSFAQVVSKYTMNPIVSDEALTHLHDDLDTPGYIGSLIKLRNKAEHGDVDAGRQLFGSLNFVGLFEGRFSVRNQLTLPGSLAGYSLGDLMDDNAGLSDSAFLSDIANHLKKFHAEDAADIIQSASVFADGTSVSDYRQVFSCAQEFRAATEQTANRLTLLREKNYAEADKIREELAAKGIQLMDYKDPDTGDRRTRWEIKR